MIDWDAVEVTYNILYFLVEFISCSIMILLMQE